jgi:hypothetical protein
MAKVMKSIDVNPGRFTLCDEFGRHVADGALTHLEMALTIVDAVTILVNPRDFEQVESSNA